MPIVTAAIGGLGAATSIFGASQGAGAAEDAAKKQEQAALMSRADQLRLMQQQRKDARPYIDSGYNALNQLNYLMGLGDPTEYAQTQDYFDADKYRAYRIKEMTDEVNKQFAKNPDKAAKIIAKRTERINANLADPTDAWQNYRKRLSEGTATQNADIWRKREPMQGGPQGEGYGFLQQRFNNDLFEKDPGYQFRMDEGARAVDASAAARQGLLSGAAMKAMQRYGQGYASNEYGNAYNRFTGDQQNMYNRLAGIAGTGQQQMNTTAQMRQNAMNNASNYMQDAAAAQASGIMGANNARQSAYGYIGNALMGGLNRGFAQGEPNGYQG